jgi:hypothetical protein
LLCRSSGHLSPSCKPSIDVMLESAPCAVIGNLLTVREAKPVFKD